MTTALKQKDTVSYPPLNALDRCDGNYSSQALVRLVRGNQDLCLSAHYFNQAELTLISQGWMIYEDIREAVLNPPKTAYDTSEH